MVSMDVTAPKVAMIVMASIVKTGVEAHQHHRRVMNIVAARHHRRATASYSQCEDRVAGRPPGWSTGSRPMLIFSSDAGKNAGF
jgi:hypothetical protein